MKLKHVSNALLTDKNDRKAAMLAFQARQDTVFGGTAALSDAKRMKGSHYDWCEIVSHVYSRSTGKPCPIWEAWECPECGQAHLGQEAALNCCSDCNS